MARAKSPKRKTAQRKPAAATTTKPDDTLPPGVEWRTVRVLVYTGPMEGSSYMAARVEARLTPEQRIMIRRMTKAQQLLDQSWNHGRKCTHGNTIQKLLEHISKEVGLNGKGEAKP